jgi:hypothetical protein
MIFFSVFYIEKFLFFILFLLTTGETLVIVHLHHYIFVYIHQMKSIIILCSFLLLFKQKMINILAHSLLGFNREKLTI